ALVDIPLFWTLLCLMFAIMLLFNHTCPLQASTVPPLIICIIGYGVSLVLLVYVIAFKFRQGRSNRYVWSFIFILMNFTLSMLGVLHEALYFAFSILIPMFSPLGWL
ncbi:ABCA5 protein, partial [Zapornia atra]|nr:ABCA5 protein [Zapornia atra]